MIKVDIINGCNREKEGRPCQQGSTSGNGMVLTTEFNMEDRGEGGAHEIYDEETGQPLIQAVMERAKNETFECPACDAKCKILLDAQGHLMNNQVEAPTQEGRVESKDSLLGGIGSEAESSGEGDLLEGAFGPEDAGEKGPGGEEDPAPEEDLLEDEPEEELFPDSGEEDGIDDDPLDPIQL
jgi:hypothetical protein